MTDTDPQVIPYLLYNDAGAALDWLDRAFGFSIRTRSARADGTVRHAEMQLDNGGVIVLGSPGPGFAGPAALGGVTQMVRVTGSDLAAHREHAIVAGAQVSDAEPGPAGWISYTASDPEGHQRYFTQPTNAVDIASVDTTGP